jgi:hypothetical protein
LDSVVNLEGQMLFMSNSMSKTPDSALLRPGALSRWENEGGAARPSDSLEELGSGAALPELPELTNAELMQLRVRVIALENLVISLLSQSSDRQLNLVREMAAYISPRPGFTPHPLTIRAAAEMIHLVDRAKHFSDMPAL